ncbi:30S ribosomal protein S17 [Candidatus Peregrinibacteria bacterium]|jgi:small subunit ribosomal protein S17|nr:30S ribosomal protein S17 [Candidatus Peregrinibacteria bacterium]
MRSKKGTIIKKTEKTLNVEVHAYKVHPKYKKKYRTTNKFLVHNPENKYEVGDTITFYETKPISKRKCWHVELPTSEPKASAK